MSERPRRRRGVGRGALVMVSRCVRLRPWKTSARRGPSLVRHKHVLAGLAAFALGTWLGCHNDEPYANCEDGHCECAGNDCICPASGDCDIECTDDCDLQCAASGNCAFSCGVDCLAECTGAGNCEIAVDDNSVVRCTGSGNCDIVCYGPCVIDCPGQGDCALTCDPDDDEPLEGPIECGDHRSACGACD